MEKNNKFKVIVLIAVMVSVIGLSVAFASLSRTLKINGEARVSASSWNIVWEEIDSETIVPSSGVGVQNEYPKLDDVTLVKNNDVQITGKRLNLGEITLHKPGDNVTFRINVANVGNIAARITGVTGVSVDDTYVEYSVKYSDTDTDLTNDLVGRLLLPDDRRLVTIEVKFKDSVTTEQYKQIPSGGLTVNLNEVSIEYTQDDGTGVPDEKYTFSIGDRTYLEDTSTANGTYQYGTTITLRAVNRPGYTFKWSDNDTSLEKTFEIKEETALSLIYTPNEYTLTAKANGGSVNSATGWNGTGNASTKEITYTETYGLLPVATRVGYTFTGWNTKADGTGENITSETTVSTIDNQDIYAQWTINKYNLNVSSSVNGTKSTTGHSGFTFDVFVNNSLVANDVITYSSKVDYNSPVRIVLNSKTNYTTVESTIEKTITDDTELVPTWITSSKIGIQFKYGNSTLIVITEGRTWENAESYAQSIGGHLAMIKTADMQNYVYNTILANSNVSSLASFWIGATDKAKEGEWRWVDGTPLSSTYTNWNGGEPNDSNGEDYCQYYISGGTKGKWNDLNGTQSYPFVVQIGNP